jgi:chemotaxis signal transduction protein
VKKLLISRIGNRLVGWTGEDVSEVLPPTPIFRLPENYPNLLGTVFHRGKLLTVVDGATLLKAEKHSGTPLLLRLRPPFDHLTVTVDMMEAAISYNDLDLQDTQESGLWAGLFPKDDEWISVIRCSEIPAVLGRAMAEVLRHHHTGRNDAVQGSHR